MKKIYNFIKGIQLTYIGKQEVNPGSFTFKFTSEKQLNWKAGQHMLFEVPHAGADKKGKLRMFSVSSAPLESEIHLTTKILDTESSSYKKALLKLQPGSIIKGRGPVGGMVIDEKTNKYVFIAGGIGITPFRSILVQLTKEQKNVPVKLLYANRNDEVAFKSELDTLAAQNPNIKISYFIGENHITKESITENTGGNLDTTFFISGPLPMVKSIWAMLVKMGVPKKNIKCDNFRGLIY
jgi:ferredoxin-NADP reductase